MTIQDVFTRLTGMLHGTTLDSLADPYGVLNQAASQILLELDPLETVRIQQLTNPIYNQVYDYAIPEDLKMNRVIDIRPQLNRDPSQRFIQQYNQDFDLYKQSSWQDSLTIQFNTGVQTIRLNAPLLPPGVVLNTANEVDTNGTWTVTGGSNLHQNFQTFISYPACLAFDVPTAANPSTAYLENSDMQAIDLTDYVNQGALFFWVYLPVAANFTSIGIRWGEDDSNFWTRTLTTTTTNGAFVNGWNLMRADWYGSTETGTPDPEQTKYLRVSYTYNGTAMNGIGLDNLVMKLGQFFEVEYYSKYLFSDSVGVFKERVTTATDTINLDVSTENIFLWKAAEIAAQQLLDQGVAGFDIPYYQNEYTKSVAIYYRKFPSQVQKAQTSYYSINRGRRRYTGGYNGN